MEKIGLPGFEALKLLDAITSHVKGRYHIDNLLLFLLHSHFGKQDNKDDGRHIGVPDKKVPN